MRKQFMLKRSFLKQQSVDNFDVSLTHRTACPYAWCQQLRFYVLTPWNEIWERKKRGILFYKKVLDRKLTEGFKRLLKGPKMITDSGKKNLLLFLSYSSLFSFNVLQWEMSLFLTSCTKNMYALQTFPLIALWLIMVEKLYLVRKNMQYI